MPAASILDQRQVEAAPAEERIRLAYQHYGERLVLSTSFGVQSAVMLHMVTQIIPQIPILFIDTGYLFPETYRFAAELSQTPNTESENISFSAIGRPTRGALRQIMGTGT